jgi:hypothetical protein
MSRPKPRSLWQQVNLPAALPLHIARNIGPGDGGCWLWTRSKSPDGYGWASYKGRTCQAHRLVYRLLVGEPSAGLVTDHLCRVRHCVNPAHMEMVTPIENLRRGYGWAYRLTLDHCPNNHPYTEANTHVRANGYRCCRICQRARNDKARAA